MPEDDAEPVECPRCGGNALHYTCWQCGGEGEFDCYEDDPINCDQGEFERCDLCRGTGGWTVCLECGLGD